MSRLHRFDFYFLLGCASRANQLIRMTFCRLYHLLHLSQLGSIQVPSLYDSRLVYMLNDTGSVPPFKEGALANITSAPLVTTTAVLCVRVAGGALGITDSWRNSVSSALSLSSLFLSLQLILLSHSPHFS